jgi:hypothetical protein
MYVYSHQLSGPQLGQNRRAPIDQIRFIEAKVTKLTRQGRVQMSFEVAGSMDRPQALGGKKSAATRFIDEAAPDWQNLKTIAENPDVDLFDERLHARHIQQGTVVDDERELERRVIGIGKYTKSKGTENHYRDVPGLSLRCCWEKETLEGIEGPYFHPPAPSAH